MTAPDPRCPICNRLLPPPRPVPDGAWPAKARTYCSQTCATRATGERRRVLPGPSEVLLALAKARVPVRLDRVDVEADEIHPDDRAPRAVIRAFPGAAVVPGDLSADAQHDRAPAWSR